MECETRHSELTVHLSARGCQFSFKNVNVDQIKWMDYFGSLNKDNNIYSLSNLWHIQRFYYEKKKRNNVKYSVNICDKNSLT